jgi:hypothetical protein
MLLANLLISFCIFLNGYTLQTPIDYKGSSTPKINSEQLTTIKYVYELMPNFNSNFTIANPKQKVFNKIIQNQSSFVDQYAHVTKNNQNYPLSNFEKIANISSINLLIKSTSKLISFKSFNESISLEQLQVFNNIELGSNIQMTINFKFKKNIIAAYNVDDKMQEGHYDVMVVPFKEATFSGGLSKFNEYLNLKINENTQNGLLKKDIGATQIVINFSINEKGEVTNPKLIYSLGDKVIDQLIINIFSTMPKWQQAQSRLGKPVSECFTFIIGNGC